jgi:UDP-N-acetylmuramate dehydrogenase
MTILENFPLDNLNTFGIKCTARYFALVKNENDLVEIAFFLRNKKVPVFILGGGSNLLFPDGIVDALVIKSELFGRDMKTLSKAIVRLGVGSGEDWDSLVTFAIKNNLAGLENLAGIPGLVGATPVQNIGAYGQEVKNVISQVETFDLEKMTKKIWTAKECNWSYRDSIFKKTENKKYFITKVYFDLNVGGLPNLTYHELEKYFTNRFKRHPSLADVRLAVLDIRREKLPDVKEIGSAGSFFQNPIIGTNEFSELIKLFPDLPHYFLLAGLVKIPLAFILDKICHLKGLKYGKVGLYNNQPLVLVNYGGALSEEIERFANHIAEAVKMKTGIQIKWEAEKVVGIKIN